MLPARIVMANNGSFRRDDRAGAGRASPPLVAQQRAELQVINGAGEWQRYPVYIKAVEKMEPLWELISEIYDIWVAPLPPLVPTLANGEPPLFETVWRAVDSRGRACSNFPTDSKLNIVIPKPLREELFTDYGNDGERALWLKVDSGGVNRFSDFLVRVSLDFVHWHYIEVDKTLMKAWDEYKRLRKADLDMCEDDVDPLS